MTDYEEDSEDRGAVCPFCKKRNIVYEGKICPHYGGYLNVDEGYWEFGEASSLMRQVGEKIQEELQAFQQRLEELDEILSEEDVKNGARLKKEQKELQDIVEDGDGLGRYQTKRLKKIVSKAKYADDEESVAVGPKDFSNCSMLFINKAGETQAQAYLKAKNP